MTTVKTAALRALSSAAAAPRHLFGAHLSIAGGVYRAAEEALRLRFDTVQVFVKNQRQWAGPPLRPDDVARWLELASRPGFGPTVAHASYLINLASADRLLRRRSIAAFRDELERCAQLHIPYLVVHPGSAGEAPVAEALRRVASALNEILSRAPAGTAPVLETTAGQGRTLGTSFGELREILAHVEQPQRVGVCIDTCHVFAAGYDLRTPAGYAALVAEIETTVGIERIRCWHFNDSKTALGSRVDRHEHIGRGHIGSAGFRQVLTDPRFFGLPLILETPKGEDERGRLWDRVNVGRLRRIVAALRKRET